LVVSRDRRRPAHLCIWSWGDPQAVGILTGGTRRGLARSSGPRCHSFHAPPPVHPRGRKPRRVGAFFCLLRDRTRSPEARDAPRGPSILFFFSGAHSTSCRASSKRLIRLRAALRFAREPRTETILREVIADAEDRLAEAEFPRERQASGRAKHLSGNSEASRALPLVRGLHPASLHQCSHDPEAPASMLALSFCAVRGTIGAG
jgi:hypothetical protein